MSTKCDKVNVGKVVNAVRTSNDFLAILDEQIAKQSKELEGLLNEEQKLRARITQVQQWIEQAKGLRQTEARARGIEMPEPTMTGSYPFFGMTPRQAYRVVLRQKKTATKAELVEAMKRGGFQFGNKSPRRVLQFALVGDPHARKIGKDTYQWQEHSDKDAKKLALLGLTP